MPTIAVFLLVLLLIYALPTHKRTTLRHYSPSLAIGGCVAALLTLMVLHVVPWGWGL